VGSWIGAVIVVLGILLAGGYLAYKAMHLSAPQIAVPPAASTASNLTPAGAASAPIRHPIEQVQAGPASASTAALPALGDSDADAASALTRLAGDGLSSLLVRQQLIARIVATIDSLPRRGLSVYMLPVRTPKGGFSTDDSGSATVIGARNAARYAPYMKIIEAADPQALVAWYVHAYPLFQEAYRQLGYPKGYFNDRLIVVIDDLLTAPEPAQPPALVRSKTYYIYADPALESLSAGQKLLLRVGPANEATIKDKLRAIRAALVGQHMRATPEPAGSTAGQARTP
jgi:Protein of unknown function (DUF3014).